MFYKKCTWIAKTEKRATLHLMNTIYIVLFERLLFFQHYLLDLKKCLFVFFYIMYSIRNDKDLPQLFLCTASEFFTDLCGFKELTTAQLICIKMHFGKSHRP